MGHWDLWNLSTHKRLSSGKIRGAHALALSPDNRFLAAGGNYSEFRIWDLRTKKIYWDLTLAAHGNTVIDQLDFTPDGRYLV
ncbi:MAG: hypothetical protein EBV06_15925, partial [Planctomycetia bacterium]|nr:hypothetical protein [Planctomycetia bacterium]